MPIIEDLKEYAERATGLRRPGKGEASDFARARKPHTVRFKDDGLVPNHPRWPLIIYRGAVALDDRHDPAAMIEDLFEANGWGDTMRFSASRAARGGSAMIYPPWCDYETIRRLDQIGYELIECPREEIDFFPTNALTIEPRRIIMNAAATKTKALLESTASRRLR
jgi:hypothetical protein